MTRAEILERLLCAAATVGFLAFLVSCGPGTSEPEAERPFVPETVCGELFDECVARDVGEACFDLVEVGNECYCETALVRDEYLLSEVRRPCDIAPCSELIGTCGQFAPVVTLELCAELVRTSTCP